MNIIARGQAFVESLKALARRSVRDWRRCPHCGGDDTYRNGNYWRRPWGTEGRQAVPVQRHYCRRCRRSYAEERAWLVPGSWYTRAVHRLVIDTWQHMGSSLRRVAEHVRSEIGRQERWTLWQVAEEEEEQRAACYLGASTLHRWLNRAGQKAQEHIVGQLEGVPSSGQMGTDGLWARLRGQGKRVLLGLVDSVSGVIWGVAVVAEEESAACWEVLFKRAQQVGLALDRLSGLTSDGAQGLLSYLRQAFGWVHHQRCVWHFWRGVAKNLAEAAAQAALGLAEEMAKEVKKQVREELVALVHAVVDATSYEQAEQALAVLKAHPWGLTLARKVNEQFDRLLFPLLAPHRGLVRVGPEWLWRDFRLRLSHARNHGSAQRLERAALLWSIYRNLTPAQERRERKRHYQHPGQSPLEVATDAPITISYLDALEV